MGVALNSCRMTFSAVSRSFAGHDWFSAEVLFSALPHEINKAAIRNEIHRNFFHLCAVLWLAFFEKEPAAG